MARRRQAEEISSEGMAGQNRRHRTRISLLVIVMAYTLSFAHAWSVAVAQTKQSSPVPRVTSSPHSISPAFFGVNIENSYSNPVPSWTDPRLYSAIKKVGIQAVRFPGGDVGNFWNWKDGTVYPFGKASKTQDSLSALSNLTRTTGTYPIYNLNVMTLNNAVFHREGLPKAVENQLSMLEAARDLKLPVQDIELGNEFFWSS